MVSVQRMEIHLLEPWERATRSRCARFASSTNNFDIATTRTDHSNIHPWQSLELTNCYTNEAFYKATPCSPNALQSVVSQFVMQPAK